MNQKLITAATYQVTSINPRTGKPYSIKQIYAMMNDKRLKVVTIDGRKFIEVN